MDEILKRHSAEKVKKLSGINGVVVNISKNNKLKQQKEVKYVEDDIILSIDKKSIKDDDTLPNVIPQVMPWGIEYMEAPEYWGTSDTDNVKIGVVDTGIDLNHPDLVENIKGRFNAIRKNKSANDDNGHGTHVAGIIAACMNEFGVVGMVPDADIFAIKVMDSNGDGYVSDIIEGIDWAIQNDLDILYIFK